MRVVIPATSIWTADSWNIHRELNLEAVSNHLVAAGYEPVMLGASPWSPGRARNRGAAWTVTHAPTQLDTPSLFVFNDADTICPPAQIREAMRLAEEASGLVFAYDLYCRVNQAQTEFYREHQNGDILKLPVERTILNSGSMGCVAISRACFEEVGGFDESYVGWGYEDLDFATRCNRLWPNRRVSGPVFHLWHGDRRTDDAPDDSDPDQVRENEARWQASTV